MRVTCRPQMDFPPEFHATPRSNQFSASWSETLHLLEREIDKVGGRSVVVELAITEQEISVRSGWPLASARPTHPGVVVSFESKHGPLRYGTDAFPHWHANLRAIALGLEALRRVERYGIGKRGEQYVGWKQLPAGPDGDVERGRVLIADAGGVTAALKTHHPDHGGDPEDFRAVQAARALR